MTVAIWILSALLIAGFVMAPINLWTGRDCVSGADPTTSPTA